MIKLRFYGVYIMDKFCPMNCKWLNVSEAEQMRIYEDSKQMIKHICLKYGVQLLHLEAHPNLYRCTKCGKESTYDI